MSTPKRELVSWFETLRVTDIPSVGGKNASLGEMINAGLPVPLGFAVTAYAYEKYLDETRLVDKIYKVIESTITDKTPLFTWVAATGATGYQIQVADTDTFDSPLIYNIYSAAVSYAPVNALPDGIHYWRMMVTTATGGSNWTTPFKFTVTP